ncbi:MAG: hypothetical protein AAFX87_08405 [Bacteroidota bacterium]
MKHRIFTLFAVAMIMTTIFSCTTQKKHYYTFSTYQYHKPQEEQNVVEEEEENFEVEEETIYETYTEDEQELVEIDQFENQLESLDTPIQGDIEVAEEQILPNGIAVKSRKEYTKQEKKQIRKDFKQSIKTFAKAKKMGNEQLAKKSSLELTGYLRTGVILGGVGILLLILSFGVDVLVFFGTVLLLAGIVFILIDVL